MVTFKMVCILLLGFGFSLCAGPLEGPWLGCPCAGDVVGDVVMSMAESTCKWVHWVWHLCPFFFLCGREGLKEGLVALMVLTSPFTAVHPPSLDLNWPGVLSLRGGGSPYASWACSGTGTKLGLPC